MICGMIEVRLTQFRLGGEASLTLGELLPSSSEMSLQLITAHLRCDEKMVDPVRQYGAAILHLHSTDAVYAKSSASAPFLGKADTARILVLLAQNLLVGDGQGIGQSALVKALEGGPKPEVSRTLRAFEAEGLITIQRGKTNLCKPTVKLLRLVTSEDSDLKV